MLGASAFVIAGTVGNVVGAWLYEHGGLVPCIVTEAVFTVALIPVLWRLPHTLIASRDREDDAGAFAAAKTQSEGA
jgi:hypothetical protein